nr:MAG TPA: hypothetical protein [Caudoviricetes sp.]
MPLEVHHPINRIIRRHDDIKRQVVLVVFLCLLPQSLRALHNGVEQLSTIRLLIISLQDEKLQCPIHADSVARISSGPLHISIVNSKESKNLIIRKQIARLIAKVPQVLQLTQVRNKNPYMANRRSVVNHDLSITEPPTAKAIGGSINPSGVQACRPNNTIITDKTRASNLTNTNLDVVVVERTLVRVNVPAAEHLAGLVMDAKLRSLTTHHSGLGQDGLAIGTTTLRKEDPCLLATDNRDEVGGKHLQTLQRVRLDLRALANLRTNLIDECVVLGDLSQSRVGHQHKPFRHIRRMPVTDGRKSLVACSHNGIERQSRVLHATDTTSTRATSELIRNGREVSLRLVGVIKHVRTKRLRDRIENLKQNQQVLSTRSKRRSILRETCNHVPLIVDKRLEGELDTSTMLAGGDKRTLCLVRHGGVGGEFRDMRQRADRVLVAPVVDGNSRGVRLQRQERSRTEIRQQLLRRNIAPQGVVCAEVLLEAHVRGCHEHGRELVRGDGFLQASLCKTVTCKGLSQLSIEVFLVLETHFNCLLSGDLCRRNDNLHLLIDRSGRHRLLQPADNDIRTRLDGRHNRLGASTRRSLHVHRITSLGISSDLASQLEHTTSDTHRGVARAIQAIGRSSQDLTESLLRLSSRRANLRLKNASNAVRLVNDNDITRLKMSLRSIDRQRKSIRVLENLIVLDDRDSNRHNRHSDHQPIFLKVLTGLSSTGVAVAATASFR